MYWKSIQIDSTIMWMQAQISAVFAVLTTSAYAGGSPWDCRILFIYLSFMDISKCRKNWEYVHFNDNYIGIDQQMAGFSDIIYIVPQMAVLVVVYIYIHIV